MSNNKDARNLHTVVSANIPTNSKIGKSFHKAMKACKTERERHKLRKHHWNIRHSSDMEVSTNAMIAILDLMLQVK